MKNWSFFPPNSNFLHFPLEPLLQHPQVQPGKSHSHFHHPLLILLVLSLGARLASLSPCKGFLEDLWESEPQPALLKPGLVTSAAKGIYNNKIFLFIASKDIKLSCSECTYCLLCIILSIKQTSWSFFLSFSHTLQKDTEL